VIKRNAEMTMEHLAPTLPLATKVIPTRMDTERAQATTRTMMKSGAMNSTVKLMNTSMMMMMIIMMMRAMRRMRRMRRRNRVSSAGA
jgi:hypothetical protein